MMNLKVSCNPYVASRKSTHCVRHIFAVLILCVLSLGMVRHVLAADEFADGGLLSSCYSYPAVAMMPYDRSIQENLYRMTHERVYHQSGVSGTILLYGPLQPWNDMFGDGVRFSATFRDPDGPGEASEVVAQLRFVGPGGIRIIRTLKSNEHAHATDDIQVMSTSVSWNELNQRDGYYVVRLYIKRDDTTLVPAAFGYNLCSAIF